MTKTTGQYEDMKADAKEILTTNDVKTVKALREKYSLSLFDAKNMSMLLKRSQLLPINVGCIILSRIMER